MAIASRPNKTPPKSRQLKWKSNLAR